ncbi:ABA4-like family protein [Falsiroseomonas oryziterrae]|uniref:ABA4-like family protein n=1 Tax=Falsiroseomonas oryziterrae TaxID=2911368 RepID=UPI001F44792D|nr:ABA4-like family protein [Roseomonas sp. NPKOSM-4]
MPLETVFSAANMLAMAGWLALLVAPRLRVVHWHLAGLAIPVLLAAVYAVLLAIHAPGAEGGFSSLAGVAALFRTEGVLLAGWVHYLAFDLFIGAWICRRGAAEGMNPWLVRLCLPPTFLAGPVGLLLFLGLRAAFVKEARA